LQDFMTWFAGPVSQHDQAELLGPETVHHTRVLRVSSISHWASRPPASCMKGEANHEAIFSTRMCDCLCEHLQYTQSPASNFGLIRELGWRTERPMSCSFAVGAKITGGSLCLTANIRLGYVT
jgi:hypothetical protein